MARTANVFARVEPEIKDQAEIILNQLGISMSNAVGMFLRQIVFQNGIPFDVKLVRKPLKMSVMTKELIDSEIQKGINDMENNKVYSVEEVENEMQRLYDL